MNCKLKKLGMLPLLVSLMAGCASTRPPSVPPVQVPAPPAELMVPLPPSPVNVQELLQKWTNMLEGSPSGQ